jgi:hypothetical protein
MSQRDEEKKQQLLSEMDALMRSLRQCDTIAPMFERYPTFCAAVG